MDRFSNTHTQFGRWRSVAIVSLLVALFAPFATATPAAAASVNESEPNDSIATANVLAVGDILTGSSFSTSAQDYDYYAVDLPKAGRLRLTFKFPATLGTGTAYAVSIYNTTGKSLYHFVLKGEHANGTWLADQGTFAPAGRLYIRIHGYSSWPAWGKTYTLNAALTPGNVETEFNDSSTTADMLTLGTTFSGSALSTSAQDYDYYAVDLPKAGRLKLTFKFPANLGTGTAYAVSIYNTTGKSLYHFVLKGEHANGTWLADQGTFAPAGRLYIRIHGYSSWPTWGKTYTLNAALTPGNVETEFNDSTSTADMLTLGTTISGSSLNTSAQDNDYYAVTVPTKQKVRIGLSFPAKLGTGNAYVLNVYDPSGKQLAYAIVMASQHNFATTLTLPAGHAHVRLYGYTSWVTWGNTYQLSALKTLTKTPQPRISGAAKVGSKLTAKPGAWAPAPVKLSYQWLRNGKAIAKATKSTYKLVKADSRKKISVKVTGSRAGFQSVAKTSKTLTIK